MKKTPIDAAVAVSIFCMSLMAITDVANASWRIEQLKDEDGKPYFGWCDDSSCPRPNQLQPDLAPVAVPVAQQDPFSVPPPSLSDSPRRMDFGALRRPAAAPIDTESVGTPKKPTKNARNSNTAKYKAIDVLPETKYARPARVRNAAGEQAVFPAPLTPKQEREVAEARRQALERSAKVSPVVLTESSVAPRTGQNTLPSATLPTDQSSRKVELILNPGR